MTDSAEDMSVDMFDFAWFFSLFRDKEENTECPAGDQRYTRNARITLIGPFFGLFANPLRSPDDGVM